ncbi:Cytochrome P450, family 94, subfamily D, polypeptide 2 [Heracleum sosnowskyi]|uniref:Cytochrome P450, family 94, subfamily D, polypeptide 2 n=1 Tax=Heracleum sosnowskyi TaxID=360622 RepID=A0AAD8HGX9_9APIA|nr:Cytochrome P450, family 94, subfamily D, polypeptide 2 [Heracleum sosnowskyi]
MGHIWKVQRKTASYEFNTKSLRNFVVHISAAELQTGLIPILRESARKNRVVDLQDLLERFAFDNICKLAFNVDPGCLKGVGNYAGSEFMQAFESAATLSAGRFMYIFMFLYKIKKFFNMGSEMKLKDSIKIVHEFADNIIRSRLQERVERKDEDLLSRFIQDSSNSAEMLRDIIISFILAGRDTTSSLLTWFFWLLSSRPIVVDKILQELEQIRKINSDTDTYSFDELREMQYLHAAISEALRLYPPVPVDTKLCENDDIWPDGTVIKKGWFATYNAYAMGRMESIWGEDCLEYRPERWLDENGMCKQESTFKFPVFHAGPRICLGKDMAYIQMKSVAASVLKRFEFKAVNVKEDAIPEHVLSLTLRMKDGLNVSVTERLIDT